ncbi:hypothetical protein M413DRAFT_419870 [Hebeloma cylindrosporum]|uniref:Stealth protein CR3 conserved region 3 domain-containing protein n=1 Tax=Hebeloma cylindrosporum TaxID=76867 RepID=A0A0C3C5K3_HEBCY|nr:hypothetical protein M413DRAFT_419870 [Hebeloma cylindrosporum h7]
MAATRSWKQTTFHLVANSYPIPSDAGYAEEESEEDYEERLGQVPQWLDMKKIDHEVPRFMIHHDVDLFRLLPSSPHKEVSDAEIDAWRNASLPTFNRQVILFLHPAGSLVLSMPFPHVFLMDDTYFLRPLTTSTFYSPIHGPILHLQPNLLVNPSVPGRRLPAGWSEWRGLETAAARISERFGKRGRPYLVHNARAIPLPLLHEASLTFPEAFSSTATSRFRGQNDSMPETHTLWLATHFIIERHREALLWSWVVGKWGGPKGRLTQEDKEKMWLDLGGKSGEGKKRVFWPKRESRLNAQIDLEKAELPDAGVTNYAFVSSDGYPYTYLPMARTYPPLPDQNGWADLASTPTGDKVPVVCTVERTDCFNNDANEPAVEMFKRIMVDKPRCGDCLISALIGASGPTGFSAFLPPSISPKLPHSSMPNHLPVSLASLLAFPYPANPYLFSLRLIQRYSYVLGGTPNRFFGVESAINAKAHLTKIDSDADAALVCINDDLASTDPIMVAALDEVLREWMVSRWPDKLEIERFNGTYSGEWRKRRQ